MSEIATPARTAADTAEPHRAYAPKTATLLTRARAILGRIITRDRSENGIVKNYQGHAWCDSTERKLNHDIMFGRHRWPLG